MCPKYPLNILDELYEEKCQLEVIIRNTKKLQHLMVSYPICTRAVPFCHSQNADMLWLLTLSQ